MAKTIKSTINDFGIQVRHYLDMQQQAFRYNRQTVNGNEKHKNDFLFLEGIGQGIHHVYS